MPGLIYCPHCRGPIQDDGRLAGQTLICPRCRGQFNVPGPQPQHKVEPTSVYSTAVSRRFKQSSSPLDIFFDFRFEMYLTPLIIRATWIIAIACTVVGLSGLAMSLAITAAPEKQGPQMQRGGVPMDVGIEELHAPQAVVANYGAWKTVFYAAVFVGSILALLWLRVCLEAVIVIFNIAESLESIDGKTRE